MSSRSRPYRAGVTRSISRRDIGPAAPAAGVPTIAVRDVDWNVAWTKFRCCRQAPVSLFGPRTGQRTPRDWPTPQRFKAGIRAPKTDRPEQRRSAYPGMISAPMGMNETCLSDEYYFSLVWWHCW